MRKVPPTRPCFDWRVQDFFSGWRGAQTLGWTLALIWFGNTFVEATPKPHRQITLTTQSVPLSPANPAIDRVGALRFLGGLDLRSSDSGFGGLSGLTVLPDQGGWKVIAVTDQGDVFSARLILKSGQLTGLTDATMAPLLDEAGRPWKGKPNSDAESIAHLGDGRAVVGFERRHRIQVYGPGLEGPARGFRTPRNLSNAPLNGGLESLASWPDGRLLAITEQSKGKSGLVQGFLLVGDRWSTVDWTPSGGGFEPSDAAVLPNGDLLVLERYWSIRNPLGLSSRILRVKGDLVRPGATLQGEPVAEITAPLTSENFEGITAFTDAFGRTQLLLVSDDNFSPLQRTLMLLFEIGD